jgi:hypothetical protein
MVIVKEPAVAENLEEIYGGREITTARIFVAAN